MFPVPWWSETVVIPLPDWDDDKDGVTALAEFTFGTNPFDAHSTPAIESSTDSGHLIVTLPASRPLSDGVRCVLQVSDDMVTWHPAASETVTPAPPGKVRYRLLTPLNAQGRTFVRGLAEFYGP